MPAGRGTLECIADVVPVMSGQIGARDTPYDVVSDDVGIGVEDVAAQWTTDVHMNASASFVIAATLCGDALAVVLRLHPDLPPRLVKTSAASLLPLTY